MKKISVTLAVALSVRSIVLSLILPVNYSLARISHGHAVLVADGAGLPPTPPPPRNHNTVILALDGAGLPPTPPPPPCAIENSLLLLDGAGLPPTPPPPPRS
jgi:hypothetical protein